MADSSGNGAHTGGEGASSRAGGGAAAPGGGVEDARRAGQRPSSDGAVNALGLPDGIPILILSCVGVYIYLCDQSAYQRQDVYRHIYIYIYIYNQDPARCVRVLMLTGWRNVRSGGVSISLVEIFASRNTGRISDTEHILTSRQELYIYICGCSVMFGQTSKKNKKIAKRKFEKK